jgi:hypothetical protein
MAGPGTFGLAIMGREGAPWWDRPWCPSLAHRLPFQPSPGRRRLPAVPSRAGRRHRWLLLDGTTVLGARRPAGRPLLRGAGPARPRPGRHHHLHQADRPRAAAVRGSGDMVRFQAREDELQRATARRPAAEVSLSRCRLPAYAAPGQSQRVRTGARRAVGRAPSTSRPRRCSRSATFTPAAAARRPAARRGPSRRCPPARSRSCTDGLAEPSPLPKSLVEGHETDAWTAAAGTPHIGAGRRAHLSRRGGAWQTQRTR